MLFTKNPEALKSAEAIKRLKSELLSGALKHCYLLITPDKSLGSDLFTVFSTSVFCKSGGCFECLECGKILSGSHTGIKIFDKPGVAEVESIVRDLYIKPMDGDYKLYYIGNADNILPAVQNKLLKSLEEPPEYAIFFLSAANEDGVLKTVASRCEKLYETAFDKAVAARVLREEFPNDEFVDKAVLLSDGFIDKAREMITDAGFRRLFSECVEILNGLKRSGDVAKYIFRTPFEKEYLKTTLDIIEVIAGATVRGIETRNGDLVFISDITASALVRFIYLISSARKRATFHASPASVAEYLLMGILELKYLTGPSVRV